MILRHMICAATLLTLAGCEISATGPLIEIPSQTENELNMQEAEAMAVRAATIAQNRDLAVKFSQAAFTDFDPEATRGLISERYIQHNPMIPSGRDALLNLLTALKQSEVVINNTGMIIDEEFVVMHHFVTNTAAVLGQDAVVAIDVFRVQDGVFDEHWDAVTAKTSANLSGRTQFDGNKTVTDLERTDDNKALVLDFVESVLIGGEYTRMSDFVAADLAQHNSNWADGREAWMEGLTAENANGKVIRFDKVHLSVAEGNLVFVGSEGAFENEHAAIFNIFRVANGMIVEQWDSIELIPAEDQWAHTNGKF